MGQESRQDEDVVGKAGVGSGIPDWLKMQSVSPDIGLGVQTSQRLSQRGQELGQESGLDSFRAR